tara:strand:+ start:505 stop:621 length:117 start_codon:yes stop_codon:yes gene_type:complete
MEGKATDERDFPETAQARKDAFGLAETVTPGIVASLFP